MRPILKLKKHLKKMGYIVEDEAVDSDHNRWKKGYGITIYTYADNGSIDQLVNIINNPSYLGCQGIHLRQADYQLIEQAIETALKDNFEVIYIHNFKE